MIYIYVYVYIHIHINIYIYIYVHDLMEITNHMIFNFYNYPP